MTMTAENEQPDAEAYVMKRLRDDAWRLARQRHMEFMRQGCSYLLAHFLPPKTETFVLPGVPERSFVNPETKRTPMHRMQKHRSQPDVERREQNGR